MDSKLVNEVSEVSGFTVGMSKVMANVIASIGIESADKDKRIWNLERALREIIEQDDAGDMMYRKDGPCAVIARTALEVKK